MKNIKKLITVVLALTAISSMLLFVGCSSDEDVVEESNYQYYTAEETRDKIEEKEDLYILDIQVEEDFEEHHIEGALPTYAYPAETEEDTAKLDGVIDEIKNNDKEVLVVCPGGGGGATRTVDYLVENGVDEDRLFILENGQGGWTYDELLAM